MGQKHENFREFRTPFPLRDIRKNPRSMYARVPQVMAQFVLKIELLSHIMGTTPILEIARAYGLRPRLWLLINTVISVVCHLSFLIVGLMPFLPAINLTFLIPMKYP